MCKDIFGSDIYVHSKFSYVRTSRVLCTRAHAHSLEGTFVTQCWYCTCPVLLMLACTAWHLMLFLLQGSRGYGGTFSSSEVGPTFNMWQ